MASVTGSRPAVALDRHESRRLVGLPVLSVLVGPVGLAIHEAVRWAGERGLAVVEEPDLDALVASWVSRLARRNDLVERAAAWLSGGSGSSAGGLAGRLVRMTAHERRMVLDAAPELHRGGDAGALCRWILEHAGEPLEPETLARRLRGALPGSVEPGTALRVAAALGELVPHGRAPALLAASRSGRSDDPSSWVESAAGSLSRLAEARPSLALLLATPREAWDAFDRSAPDSRAKALARAGVVAVDGLGAAEVETHVRRGGVEPSPALAGSIRRLVADGASAELVGAFAAAISARDADEAEADPADRARSAAERFLFERLSALPETAGLFELNTGPGFMFGPSAMEVDLLCASLRVAIEVDGYYHLRDLDDYRRDRRKDFELQRRGYLVLRFLADDVVARLETVLDTILAAVALRRGRPDSTT